MAAVRERPSVSAARGRGTRFAVFVLTDRDIPGPSLPAGIYMLGPQNNSRIFSVQLGL